MPKQSIEINKFLQGIVSTPSSTDTDSNSAKYSKNIDPATAQGRLQGIDGDKKLTLSGFISEDSTSVEFLETDSSDLSVITDKKDSSKINLVSIETGDTDYIDKINLISNVYAEGASNATIRTLSESVISNKDKYNTSIMNNKVLLGTGGSETTTSKVIMRTPGHKFSDDESGDIDIFDSALDPPDMTMLSATFAEYITFQIHGNHPSKTALSYDDDTGDARDPVFYADYDIEYDNSSDETEISLHASLNGGALDALKRGQIFRITHATNDFTDNALIAWKRYDYDNDATLAAGDLFMFCGYIAGTDFVPILRFVGNMNDVGGTPAFAYAFKDNSSLLFKISLTKRVDANSFEGVSAGSVRGAAGAAHPLINIGNRVSSVDLSGTDGFNSNYISAISVCHSPLLFNNLGLEGSGDSHTTDATSVYHNNGHLKYLYRHGILYAAGRNRSTLLFRVNLIDFHDLGDGISVDSMNLDFSKIPNQLHAKDGDGVVQRTLEDQLVAEDATAGNVYDPQDYNASWSRIPADAYIIGICETFENGELDSVGSHNNTWSNAAFKFTPKALGRRLASGDKVRFAGMSIISSATENKAFNVSAPYEISVVDDGKSFYVVSGGSATHIPAINSNYPAYWWNAKVWVLYGRQSTTASFNKWDLFLYNANTLDTDNTKTIYMADRTVPYHQARYYKTLSRTASSFGDEEVKMYYPGEFMFVKKGSTNAINQLTADHMALTGESIYTQEGEDTGVYAYCQLGIYNKSGRWTINGGEPGNGPNSSEFVGHGDSLSGELYIGDNIGWSIDRERKIWPIRNSLHPLNPYSKLYMANILYHGYNSADVVDLESELGEANDFNQVGRHYHNRPRHAVTFIGKVDGDFVAMPGGISRAKTYETGSVTTANTNYATWRQDWTSEFRVEKYYLNNANRIDQYREDHTLFTIDDFSGHIGACIDDDVDATSTSDANRGKSGILIGRPNWGGPEIENPKFKAHSSSYDGIPPSEPREWSSVNGGYYEHNDDDNDKGWDGYAPPRLFTPGSGYYVYINRSWKTSAAIVIGCSAWDVGSRPSSIHWPYQEKRNWTENQPGAAATPSAWKWDSNRWSNFSSTAIGNNNNSMVKNPSEYSDKFLGEWQNTSGGGSGNFESPGLGLLNNSAAGNADWLSASGWTADPDDTYGTEDSPHAAFWEQQSNYTLLKSGSSQVAALPFETWPAMGFGICTMHRLEIDNISSINSISPFINDTEVVDLTADTYTGADHKEFFAGYLLGIDTIQNSSEVLVLRTNLDPVYDSILRQQYVRHGNIHDGIMYKRHTKKLSGSQNYKIFLETSTFFTAIAPITHKNPERYNAGAGSHKPPKIRQAVLDTSMSAYIGDGIRVFSQRPIEDNNTQDWMVSATALDSSAINFGEEENKYTLAYETANTNYGPGIPYADLKGSFIASTWTAADDINILKTFNRLLSFSESTEIANGMLTPGKYYYKCTFLYDNQYESSLQVGAPIVKELTVSAGGTWDYIRVTFNIPSDIISNLSNRVTGLVLYRKFEGADDDPYSLVREVKFSENWTSDGGNYTYSITDDGNLGWDYETITGVSQTLKNTSLNYGLSTSYQGYLYVSDAWHPDLENVQNYIFRSLLDNPFAFNWPDDLVIMPEKPIAMTTFNSRLFVWTKNKLYKLDPVNLVIEDDYQGVSIASRDSFVATEYGLCFLDENNVYLHDGNKAQPIANDILYSSNESIVYEGTHTRRIQGYRELLKDTLVAGYKPRVFYSGLKNSFVILLYSGTGLALSYNIGLKRWDLWDAPIPKGATTSKNGDILISNGTNLHQYLSNISSSDYSECNQKEWEWFSNDMTFGSDIQEKVFKTLSFTGSPSLYDYGSKDVYGSSSDAKVNTIQAFVDDVPVLLTVNNKFYDTMRYAHIKLKEAIANSTTETILIESDIAISGSRLTVHEFIRKGQIIKIDDEIMLVTAYVTDQPLASIEGYNSTLTVKRGIMNTTAVAHDDASEIYIVAPKLKFPGGTKGNRLKLQLLKQSGYIDSINISYKPKSIK